MKHQRITATVNGGHLPSMVRRQIVLVLAGVKDGTDIVIEMFQRPQRRSMAQNDAFHAMVRPWAKEEGWDIDELKRDLLGTVFGWDGSPLGENRVPKEPHTSSLSKEDFAELMERTVEIAARQGVILQLPDEYNASKWMPDSMKRVS